VFGVTNYFHNSREIAEMKVLIAIDHSDASSLVIDAIVKAEWPEDLHFKLVHVLAPLEEMGTTLNISTPEWHESLNSAQEQLRSSAQVLLSEYAEKLKSVFPNCKCTLHLEEKEDQPVDACVLSIAGDWQPDLIVVGSHGKRGLTRLLLGSVSFSLLCQSSCSVRIVKQAVFPAAENFFNVLLPIDNTEHSKLALASISERPWHPSTRFRLLTVLPPVFSHGPLPVSGSAAIYELNEETEELEQASATLKEQAETLARSLSKSHHVDSVAVRGDARDAIIEQAYNFPAGLIVMGNKPKTALSRFFLGSVSSAVALVAPCSVEVVRQRTLSM